MPKLSVTIITLNEAEHIAAAIDSVSWADEILVIDAHSTDATVDIARARGARVERRAWNGWIEQKNHAAAAATHDWIFSLDADERVTPGLTRELQTLLANDPSLHGYRMPRVSSYLGRWIRTTDFYPDFQTRLYDRRAARWRGGYVHESVEVDGPTGTLRNELQHYSFRNLSDHFDRITRYSTLAARQMHESGRAAGPIALVVHPIAAFLRNYILRRGCLDGGVGLTISLMNAYGVFAKFARLWELGRRPAESRQPGAAPSERQTHPAQPWRSSSIDHGHQPE